MATPVLRAPFTYLVLGTPPEPTNGAQMPNAFRDVASYYGAQLAGVSPGEFVMGALVRIGKRYGAIPAPDNHRTIPPQVYTGQWPTLPRPPQQPPQLRSATLPAAAPPEAPAAPAQAPAKPTKGGAK